MPPDPPGADWGSSQAWDIGSPGARKRIGCPAAAAAVIPESNTTIIIGGSETINASSISFLGNDDTVSGGTLNLGSAGGTIDVEGSSATISSTIIGGGLTETGNGTDLLTAANGYTGMTIVSAGTLEEQSPGSLPGYDAPDMVSVASGATLAVMVGGSSDWNSNPMVSDDIATLLTDATFASGSSLGIDTSVGSFTCTTNIADSGGGVLNLSLVKLGNDTLTLDPPGGSNNYSGTTTVIAGTLKRNRPRHCRATIPRAKFPWPPAPRWPWLSAAPAIGTPARATTSPISWAAQRSIPAHRWASTPRMTISPTPARSAIRSKDPWASSYSAAGRSPCKAPTIAPGEPLSRPAHSTPRDPSRARSPPMAGASTERSPPIASLSVDNASLSGPVGEAVNNTVTCSYPSGDSVSLTASMGGLTNNGDGTWSWNLPGGAGPGIQTVTITATDNSASPASTALQTFQVDLLAPTQISTVTFSPGTLSDGSPVTLNATVSAVDGSYGTPSGNVDFYDGSTDLGSVAVDGSGQASLSLPSLPMGDHGIIAVYDGDDNFAQSTVRAHRPHRLPVNRCAPRSPHGQSLGHRNRELHREPHRDLSGQ